MVVYEKEILIKACRDSKTWVELLKKLNINYSTNSKKAIERNIDNYYIDISHFDRYYKNKQNVKYKNIIKKCLICDKNFETKKGHPKEKKYCSQKCANKLSVGDRHSKKTNKKRSETIKLNFVKSLKKNEKIISIDNQGEINNRRAREKECLFCGMRFYSLFNKTKFCSNSCSTKFKWKDPSYRNKIINTIKAKVKNGTHKGWRSRNKLSYPEKFFKKVLEENGYKGRFEINFPVTKKSLGVKGASCYFLDFYFPDFKIDLEIDGKQHKEKDRRKSDKKRDVLLTKNGYKVIRIEWKSINTPSGKEYINEEIKKLLSTLNNLSRLGVEKGL